MKKEFRIVDMLTRNDINLLKAIFITKEEFRSELESKLNSSTNNLRNELRDEFRAEMKKSTETIVNEIKDLIEMIGTYIGKTERVEKEIADHHIILSTHETRLRKLE